MNEALGSNSSVLISVNRCNLNCSKNGKSKEITEGKKRRPCKNLPPTRFVNMPNMKFLFKPPYVYFSSINLKPRTVLYGRQQSFVDEVIYIVKRFTSQCKNSKTKTPFEVLEAGQRCLANNYCPYPIVVEKGKGCYVYDAEGKSYLDFISGQCAVSLGHCHPKICSAIVDQAKQLTLTTRLLMSKPLSEFGEYLTELFGYEKVLPMNSGNEACETAVKLARRWGYRVKRICPNQAKILFAENNFWGRSIAAVSASTTPTNYHHFGPFVPCFDTVPFNDVDALFCKIVDPNVCAFMVEPIQGEAGVVIPDPCYLKQVREMCTQKKVLMIADEVQCGIGRTGCMLCCDIYKVRPDILVLGKALSGGFMPVSAVLTDANIMDLLEPGSHGSTYGGNPLGCRIAVECLKALQEEKLIANARQMGELLRECLCDLPKDIVCEVRGVGLLNALVLNPGINAINVGMNLMRNGLLVGISKQNIIRLTPPLSIKEKDIQKAAKIIRHCIEESRGSCGETEKDCVPSEGAESGSKKSLSVLTKAIAEKFKKP